MTLNGQYSYEIVIMVIIIIIESNIKEAKHCNSNLIKKQRLFWSNVRPFIWILFDNDEIDELILSSSNWFVYCCGGTVAIQYPIHMNWVGVLHVWTTYQLVDMLIHNRNQSKP